MTLEARCAAGARLALESGLTQLFQALAALGARLGATKLKDWPGRCTLVPRMTCRRLLLTLLACLVVMAALAAPAAAKAQVHEVKKGETLSHIARRYHVTITALRAKNGIRRGKPIFPGQKIEIPNGNSKPKPGKEKNAQRGKKESKKAGPNDWVTAKPDSNTQTQKSSKNRGGVNPCLTKDPGFGVYDRWSRAPSLGQMIVPQRGGVTRRGSFDVMLHFHGHEAMRKEWVKVMRGPVLVGIDLGLGSGPYASAFGSPDTFKKLLASVEKAVAEKTGKKSARVRKVGVSAWSAGYGAVGQILSQPLGRSKVDTVVLLDGLHSGYSGKTLNEAQMKPFLDYAREARRGRKFMFVSHSSIIPHGYASTTETANWLIWKLGGKPRRTRPRGSDPMGLDLISRYTRGHFHVRGYAGNDKMDHCAHLGLMKDVLKVHIRPRWRSPRGYKKKGK